MSSLRYPINGLVSFHYYKDKDLGRLDYMRLIGDSGAYSAATQGKPIDLQVFASWAKKWQHNLAWVASLDVIGDADASYKNWRALRVLGLDVVPTIHFGAKPQEIDRYAKDGIDFIGLGGMVPRKAEPKKLISWAVSMMAHAEREGFGTRFHGWGITRPDVVQVLPWYSVDSTSVMRGFRFGETILFDPHAGKFTTLYSGADAYRHRHLLADHYDGVTPEQMNERSRQKSSPRMAAAVKSFQLFEDHLRKRQVITAPKYGVESNAPAGPHVHVVMSSVDNMSLVSREEKGIA